jgi:hypothetical protein
MGHSSDDVLITQLHLRLGGTVLDAQIYWPPSPGVRVGTSLVLLLCACAVGRTACLP